ncbi:hypothetical protein C479_10835 [Halovivax asiaticus JCM 14624]|uniref:Antitoxin n=1 Tax=Halovivax asiaticus JCM 14624 TaxID=1227490 RepID=M0BEI9_9EURY|nr:antitoxin VapB family protein [Halovivax asiaticus]ELZ09311.1 hypothetical protein C479_10835 [Halovivax asiaticus JCM 14624]
MDETEYRTIRLTEKAYRRLNDRKQSEESFSDTVERLAGERSILELAGIVPDDDADVMRAAIAERDEHARERLDSYVTEVDS